jgi:predicted O-linked N-acetylglucosamine transferase (SPINDLY family)
LSHAAALEHLRAGRPQAAAALLEAHLRSEDADAQGWFLLGASRHALNDLSGAAAAFARSLVLDPTHREAHLANISVLRAARDAQGALTAAQQALTRFPHDGRVLYAAALCLDDLGQADAALVHYDGALAIEPSFEDAFHNRGLLLARLGRHEEAEANQRRYIAAHPVARRAHGALVDVLLALGRFGDALEVLDELERLAPGNAIARLSRGVALASLRRLDEARTAFAEARARDAQDVAQHVERVAPGSDPQYMLSPENIYFASCWAALGRCDWSRWNDFIAEMRKAAHHPGIAIEPTVAFMSRLLPLSGHERHAIASIVAKAIEAKAPALPPAAPCRRPRVRIGVLSPDFREHLNAYLLLPLCELLDRSRFELHAYSLAADDGSAIRGHIRSAADAFRDLQGMSDRDAAMAVRSDDIDILVDVGGYTTGARFAITAQRPARLQVNYLGFSSSFGSRRVDYAIVDRIVGSDDAEWTEARVFLPHTHFLYDFRAPPPETHVTRQDYALPADAFVYCAFHRAEKISPDAFDLWMQILSRTSKSVLWFRALTETASRNLRAHAQRNGIDPARLVFAPFEPSFDPRYLARHRLGDLMLDALHHNATTSACDALGAGLPMLTLRGSAMASRAGESLLRAAGLPELVAPDKEAYVALAVQLASDKERLNSYRRTLEARRGPLFDTESRVREIEAALTQMWRQYEQREKWGR